jgi:hypothetical protein
MRNLQFSGGGLNQTSSEKHQDVEHVPMRSFGAVYSRKTNSVDDLTDILLKRRKGRIEEMMFHFNRADDCRCQRM